MAQSPQHQNSSTQLLQELEALSQSLSHSHTTRRTTSLVLPRSSSPPSSATPAAPAPERPRSHRISLSPFRSRTTSFRSSPSTSTSTSTTTTVNAAAAEDKKAKIWNWKPMRALTHIGMHRVSCLFSVEVVAVQGLPASMSGLRLSVCVRKKETKDGAMQTMPARVLQNAADFEETLFLRCHLYCTKQSNQQLIKFESRPFYIYVAAVDARELNFGRSVVDLSNLVEESMEKSSGGTRVRQWDKSFTLAGKAKGGELVVKVGFQIMDDKGLGIYGQSPGWKPNKGKDSSDNSSPVARKQSKSSFSVTSPRISSRFDSTPSKSALQAVDLQGIDDLNLDDPAPAPSTSVQKSEPTPSTSVQKSEPESKAEDFDIPEFEVVDKGIEIQEELEDAMDEKSVSSEVVKEVVHDPVHLRRLAELDSIAQQIKALESMIGNEVAKIGQSEFQGLDAEEETVTREFLQMLEEEESSNRDPILQIPDFPMKPEGSEENLEAENKVNVPDLGKGIGSVVQTRDGGYLVAMNPFQNMVLRKETPKLAMQISKSLIVGLQKSSSGFELFQKMTGIGIEKLSMEVLSLAGMDELIGKTAEQIAFEGIASAIIHGRNKEVATSSAARSIAAVKTMVNAVSTGWKERISTGIWNVSEEPVTAEEILAFSLQKIEAMAIEALKIQAEMAQEEAPFDVSPSKDPSNPLASAVSIEDWMRSGAPTGVPEFISLIVVIQLRDPLRRYEAVGAPLIAIVQAMRVDAVAKDDEERYKVVSLHVGALKVKARGKRNAWDAEKQRLTAMQWLVSYGLGKAAKKGRSGQVKGQDCFWSISARVMADMWLKPMRNPDVKFP